MSGFIELTDFYKVDHRRQYPADTKMVYSNFTARNSRVKGQDYTIAAGLQLFLQKYLQDAAWDYFFDRPKGIVLNDYKELVDSGLGPNDVGTDHIAALHDLNYIPLRFFALPEGAKVPLRVPHFTFVNTHPDFSWVPNYFETLMSAVIWPITTSATTAHLYRRLLDTYAGETGGDPAFVPWQGHDFSFRGMMGAEAATLSGLGHLMNFTGTDTLPAILAAREYYDAEGLVGGSVAATEHSVMCAGGKEDEFYTFARLLDLYPKGVVSVVSDTWDLWAVIDQILPQLKPKIMARDGKLVIRPDSGDPVKILVGDPEAQIGSAAYDGVVARLFKQFGGAQNAEGFLQLDSHIGAIYGDSITLERADKICNGLARKGFASTNVVLGIGSFTYQYVTRDTFGHAIKATMCTVGGEERQMFKDPVTDDGVKKSAKGCIYVSRQPVTHEYSASDGMSFELAHGPGNSNLLQEVWRDGEFLRRHSLDEIRNRILED
jgi:nicotinamide phosphoribosyltransferase